MAKRKPGKDIKEKLLLNHFITPSGCWKYDARIDLVTGYSYITYQNKKWSVHRLSMAVFKPETFKTFENVNHKCNNRWCMNPEHLYSGTQTENMFDAVKANTHVQASKTQCPKGHIYDEANTLIDKSSGARRCKICRDAKNAFYRNLGFLRNLNLNKILP